MDYYSVMRKHRISFCDIMIKLEVSQRECYVLIITLTFYYRKAMKENRQNQIKTNH